MDLKESRSSGLFSLREAARIPTPSQARLGLVFALTLALGLLSSGSPWRGLAYEVHCHFDSFPVGEQATRFAGIGAFELFDWRDELVTAEGGL